MMHQHHNILFHQILITNSIKSIIELSPNVGLGKLSLIINDGSLSWQSPINKSGKLYDSELYLKDFKIGIGRSPLQNYKFDIKADSNILDTVFHIGDGTYGFSMGNGTTEGFIPEIIGMGSDENDAGLYFLGKSGSSIGSDIPLVIIGGISPKNNRPILGITSGPYNKYEFLVDQQGTVHVNDIQINGSITVKEILQLLQEQQKTINSLVERINNLTN